MLFQTEVGACADPLVAGAGYQLHIPEDVGRVRCIFMINQRGAGKRLFHRDDAWRELAAEVGAGMMLCEFEEKTCRDNGYAASMVRALEQFDEALGRPELSGAPLVLWGHSNGGRVVQDFVRYCPERVVAFHIALRMNESPPAFMEEEREAMAVPGVYLMGTEDGRPVDMRMHFERARSAGSARAWVWLPGQGHWPRGMGSKVDETTEADWRAWSARAVVIPWTRGVIAKRCATKVGLSDIDIASGWLGDVETHAIGPATNFAGDPATASWFPDEETARAWLGYVGAIDVG